VDGNVEWIKGIRGKIAHCGAGTLFRNSVKSWLQLPVQGNCEVPWLIYEIDR